MNTLFTNDGIIFSERVMLMNTLRIKFCNNFFPIAHDEFNVNLF